MKFGFKKSNIPNYLTILRIVLVPIIIIFTCVDFGPKLYWSQLPNTDYGVYFSLSWVLGGLLFIIASFTDFLDGYLSRKYHWISDFGKLWDPIADKLLINSVLIVFAGANPDLSMKVYFIIPILMIARDTIVDAFRMYAASKNVVVAANFYGKLKTVTQIIAIILIYFVYAWDFNAVNNSVWWWCVQNLFMWISLFLSLMSGGIYIWQINKKLNIKK